MSPREHLILCGPGTKAAIRGNAWRSAHTVKLDTTPASGNVHLQIHDITSRMVANLPQVAEDLIELATYVYAADQASERGSLTRFDYGKQWRRRFRFQVPVRRPDIWSDPRVTNELVNTLSFLSDDDYEFSFIPLRKPTAWPEYLEYTGTNAPPPPDVDEVMLFSGGLDSLSGAVEEVLVQRRRVALVSHRPVSKIESRQTTLQRLLTDRAAASRRVPVHVPVLANKRGWDGKDFTQRTRSFLFASFAAIVARLFGLDRIRFYENGIVSCNLPICAQVLGGRASRTTHPRVLTGFERLLSLLFDRPFRVENPFFWKTRTDVVEGLRASGHADLAAASVSCVHTWLATTAQPHCGTCSQCVDRRLATLAGRLSDTEDPSSRYQQQLLTGRLDDVLDQTMVERIVGTVREVEALQGPLQFMQKFGEVGRLLSEVPGRAEQTAVRVFELHRRHARQVNGVLDRELAIGPRREGWKDLPLTCLLRVLGGDASRAGGNDDGGGGGETGCHIPTKEDLQILAALTDRVSSLMQQDLIAHLEEPLSRRTLGKRLNTMLRYRLVSYPNGARKGVAITERGRELLAAHLAESRAH